MSVHLNAEVVNILAMVIHVLTQAVNGIWSHCLTLRAAKSTIWF